MKPTRLWVGAAAAAMLLGAGTGTAAAALPPLTLSADTIPFDGSVRIDGAGCAGLAADVAVARGNVAYLAAPPTGGDGTWSLDFDGSLYTVPEFTPGLFTVDAACNDYGSFEEYDLAQFVVLPPPGDPALDGELELSTDVAEPGEPVTVTARDMGDAYDVSAFFFSDPQYLDSLPWDQVVDGVATFDVTIPLDAEPGPHQIVVYGNGPDVTARVLGATIEVVADGLGLPDPGEPPPLPTTGGEPWSLAGGGITAIAAGAAALAVSVRVADRRRGRHFAGRRPAGRHFARR